MSYELVACVVGLTNGYKEVFGTRPGIGKSCLCFRLAYPEYDSYVDNHPSLFALHEFESRVVNSNHFIYWGSPVKFFPVRGGDCKVKFHIIEQTVFYQDVTSLPFNHSVTKPDNVDSYVKRIVGPIESTGKISYHSRDSIVTGMPAGHAVANYPSGITRLPRGFIVVFDVSVTGKALAAQCKRVDPILSYLDKHKKKFIIAVTKRDKYSMPSLEKAYELRKKYRTHLVECSALDDLNMEEVLRILALIVISKKISGLTDQVTRYHDAAQHVLFRRTSAKAAFKSYVRKKVTNYDERLVSVQLSEEFKECARWIGSYKTGCMFALHVLELYNSKVEERYAGVTDDPDMHTEYLEDFVDQRKDIEAFKAEMRRWIVSYVSEFAHAPRSKKRSQPDQTRHSEGVGSNSIEPSDSNHPVQTTTGSGQDSTQTAISNANGALSPPPTPTPTPATPTKPGQVPEGYHIFESLSKVSKNGSVKQAAEEAGAVEQSNKEEVAGADRVKGATEAAENSCKEGNVDGQEEGNDDEGEGDTASNYSDNSMESVSDHDYLNFDPKSGGVWHEESDTPLPTSNPTAAAAAAPDLQSRHISESLPSNAKAENDDSEDEYDYENLKEFIGDTDYMNVTEAIQKAAREVSQSQPDPPRGEAAETDPGSISHLAATERCEAAGVEGSQTDSSITTVATKEPRAAAPPKVSPKPGTRKTNPPPPLVLPPPSPELQCMPPSSEPSPSISSSDTSSLRPSTEDAASASSQPFPRLKKPKPATPIRRSSLNNKKIVSPLMQPTHSSILDPSSSPVHPHKPQNPVGRSSSIRQRAKLLEMSMTSTSSSEVSTEDPVVSEESTTGKSTVDSATPMHVTGNFAANRVDLPSVPELTNSHVADDSQVHTPLVTNDTPATGTTQEGATPSPNMEVRDVGVSSPSSHLSLHQAQRLAGLRSPGHLPAIPKAVSTPATTAAGTMVTSLSAHVLGSTVANDTTDIPTTSSSTSLDPQAASGLQKRPRLTQIRKKLAQKKEASEAPNGQITSDHGEIGSTSSLQLESSSNTPTRRPNLATIRKRLKESESEMPEDVPQLESELSNVSPFSSINLPPLRAHPPPPVKRGSAPAASIVQSLSSDRLKEWNTRRLKSESEENGLPNEVAPPIPERSKAIFQIVSSPPNDPVARHKEYFNVLMKTKKDSSTAKAVTPAERSNVTSPFKESTVPAPRKMRGADEAANQHSQPSSKIKSKKEEKDQTQKEQQTSPIKKAFAYLTVKNKDHASTKKKDEVVPQTRAKFINMATRPLPMIPGQSYDASDEPDHTERDYEEFGSHSGVGGDEVEYLNYPNLPAAVAHVHGNRVGRSQSQEPQLPALTTRSAPNTPMLNVRSQTLGRPGTKRAVGAARQLSRDDDGYINSDLLPDPMVLDLPYRAPIPIPINPPAEHASEGQGSLNEETNSDYDYPDLRLTGAFNTPYAKQQAITKLERSKVSAYDFQQPRKTREMRTRGDSSDANKDALGEEGDDQGLRDRTWSTASSTYVPMANLYPGEDEDEDDYVPPNDVEIDELTQRFKFRSALDRGGSDLPKLDEQEDMAEASECGDQSETVYMNLPVPEKVSAVVPPQAVPPRPSLTSSMDDSHVSSKTKYPVVKPKPTKKRSATFAADISAEVKEVSPHEGWNKTGIIRESEDGVPPRNILRQTVV